MSFDRAQFDDQIAGDLGIRVAGGDQPQYLALALTERLPGGHLYQAMGRLTAPAGPPRARRQRAESITLRLAHPR